MAVLRQFCKLHRLPRENKKRKKLPRVGELFQFGGREFCNNPVGIPVGGSTWSRAFSGRGHTRLSKWKLFLSPRAGFQKTIVVATRIGEKSRFPPPISAESKTIGQSLARKCEIFPPSRMQLETLTVSWKKKKKKKKWTNFVFDLGYRFDSINLDFGRRWIINRFCEKVTRMKQRNNK